MFRLADEDGNGDIDYSECAPPPQLYRMHAHRAPLQSPAARTSRTRRSHPCHVAHRHATCQPRGGRERGHIPAPPAPLKAPDGTLSQPSLWIHTRSLASVASLSRASERPLTLETPPLTRGCPKVCGRDQRGQGRQGRFHHRAWCAPSPGERERGPHQRYVQTNSHLLTYHTVLTRAVRAWCHVSGKTIMSKKELERALGKAVCSRWHRTQLLHPPRLQTHPPRLQTHLPHL